MMTLATMTLSSLNCMIACLYSLGFRLHKRAYILIGTEELKCMLCVIFTKRGWMFVIDIKLKTLFYFILFHFLFGVHLWRMILVNLLKFLEIKGMKERHKKNIKRSSGLEWTKKKGCPLLLTPSVMNNLAVLVDCLCKVLRCCLMIGKIFLQLLQKDNCFQLV